MGDSCIDRFIYGTCDRLSPEAPVPILNYVETKEMPGMAANVVKNLEAFMPKLSLLTQDNEIVKTRYVDLKSNQHIMRIDNDSDTVSQNTGFSIFETTEIKRAIGGEFDLVILSDYDKGFLKKNQMHELTNKLTCLTCVDSKKLDLNCFKKSILKLNKKEYAMAENTIHKTSDVITTIGSKGAVHNNIIYPAESVEVFDVSGAGDTFLSAFSVYHAITRKFDESIVFANKCASIVVQKKGTYAIRNQGW